jgi:hypothetical protein
MMSLVLLQHRYTFISTRETLQNVSVASNSLVKQQRQRQILLQQHHFLILLVTLEDFLTNLVGIN